MTMSEFQICQFIKEARDPLERVEICAQMNLCGPEEIRKICERNGLNLPKKIGSYKSCKWTHEKVEAIRKELEKGKKKKDVALKFGISVYGLSYVIRKYIPERRKKKAPCVGAQEAAV